MEDTEGGECAGPSAERTGKNVDNSRLQGEHSMARDSFDLNHTIWSRQRERISDDLGFSNDGQNSDSGTAGLLKGLTHQNHLPNYMIPAVREWLKSQRIRVQLPGSPLGTRLSKKIIERRNSQGGPRQQRKGGGSEED